MTGDSGFQVAGQAPDYYESHVSLFMQPFVDALVGASVRAGDHVLDVACGTGFAARAAALAAGGTGRVTRTDINPGMLAKARERDAAEGGNITWAEAPAADIPYDDVMFDAVISQQGLQFFPDKPTCLREMARVTKPGGRIAATVWAPEGRTPYLDAVFGLLAERCGGDPGANRIWRVDGGEAEVRSWFASVGLEPVSVEEIEAVVLLPPAQEFVVDHVRALPPPSVGGFFDMPAADRAAYVDAVAARVSAFATERGLELPFRSYLAVAGKATA